MNYELTRHAQKVLQEREIEIEWLERVLMNPASTMPDPMDADMEHRIGKIVEYGDRVLRVVVNTKVEPFRVVTVYFDRKMKGKL